MPQKPAANDGKVIPLSFSKYAPPKPPVIYTVIKGLLIVLGITSIVALAVVSPREKTLHCSGAPHSLTGFGSCTTD